jgi:hypothetical protein
MATAEDIPSPIHPTEDDEDVINPNHPLPASSYLPPSNPKPVPLAPLAARVTVSADVLKKAAQARERIYAAEVCTDHATIDAGRKCVRTSLATAAKLMFVPAAPPPPPPPTSAAAAASSDSRAIGPSNPQPSLITAMPWSSWTQAARERRWTRAGNPSLGI